MKNDRTRRRLFAAARGDLDALAAALADGADLEANDAVNMTPLTLAVRNGPVQAALLTAAYRGDTKAVRTALTRGANPNACDDQDASALPWAARHGHTRWSPFATHYSSFII